MVVADQGPQGACITPPETLADLARLLEAHQVDLEQWGTGEAKTIEDLAAELRRGECRLLLDASGRLVRAITVVGVDVFFNDDRHGALRLVEAEQKFRSGRRRNRRLRTSLGEKLLPGEQPVDAAKRAIEEELGLPAAGLTLVPSGSEVTKGNSNSFPGLWSSRCLTYFECTLPSVLFRLSGYEERQRDKTTHFSWRAAV